MLIREWYDGSLMEGLLVWGTTIIDHFPFLFSLAVNKEALVAHVWNPVGEEGEGGGGGGGGGGGPLISLDLSIIGN